MPNVVKCSGIGSRSVKNSEHDALQWLTVEELAARRRDLVREYDRALRQRDPDQIRVAEIWAEADAIAEVQRARR